MPGRDDGCSPGSAGPSLSRDQHGKTVRTGIGWWCELPGSATHAEIVSAAVILTPDGTILTGGRVNRRRPCPAPPVASLCSTTACGLGPHTRQRGVSSSKNQASDEYSAPGRSATSASSSWRSSSRKTSISLRAANLPLSHPAKSVANSDDSTWSHRAVPGAGRMPVAGPSGGTESDRGRSRPGISADLTAPAIMVCRWMFRETRRVRERPRDPTRRAVPRCVRRGPDPADPRCRARSRRCRHRETVC